MVSVGGRDRSRKAARGPPEDGFQGAGERRREGGSVQVVKAKVGAGEAGGCDRSARTAKRQRELRSIAV
jgi:hypothetical protein